MQGCNSRCIHAVLRLQRTGRYGLPFLPAEPPACPGFSRQLFFPLKPRVRAHCICFQEYAQGGNLFSYVQAAGRLTEPMARWVLARGR